MTKEQLKEFRTLHRLTRKALAEILQVAPNHIYMMESGRRPITHIMGMALRSLTSKRKSA